MNKAQLRRKESTRKAQSLNNFAKTPPKNFRKIEGKKELTLKAIKFQPKNAPFFLSPDEQIPSKNAILTKSLICNIYQKKFYAHIL